MENRNRFKIGNNPESFLYTGSYRAAFERMRELGYDTADVSLADTEKPWYADDAAMAAHCAAVRADAEAAGIEICQVHGPWPTDDKTEESRAAVAEFMKRAVLGCGAMNGRNLVIHPQMPFGWGKEEVPGLQYALTERLMRTLLPLCAANGVTVCLENMPTLSHAVAKIPEIVGLVVSLASPYAGVCLDTGHCNVCGEDPGEAVRASASVLRVLHIHDNDGRSDRHLLPFFGTADWESFTGAIAESGFSGSLSLETKGFVNAAQPPELRARSEELTARTAEYLAKSAWNQKRHMLNRS